MQSTFSHSNIKNLPRTQFCAFKGKQEQHLRGQSSCACEVPVFKTPHSSPTQKMTEKRKNKKDSKHFPASFSEQLIYSWSSRHGHLHVSSYIAGSHYGCPAKSLLTFCCYKLTPISDDRDLREVGIYVMLTCSHLDVHRGRESLSIIPSLCLSQSKGCYEQVASNTLQRL